MLSVQIATEPKSVPGNAIRRTMADPPKNWGGKRSSSWPETYKLSSGPFRVPCSLSANLLGMKPLHGAAWSSKLSTSNSCSSISMHPEMEKIQTTNSMVKQARGKKKSAGLQAILHFAASLQATASFLLALNQNPSRARCLAYASLSPCHLTSYDSQNFLSFRTALIEISRRNLKCL